MSSSSFSFPYPSFSYLIAIVVGVNGRDIRTGNVQLDPPKISEVVDLYLSANIATTIPQLGHIEYIFPSGSSVPFETQDGCKLVSLSRLQ